MTPEKQSLPLIRRIYDAALDPGAWQGLVEDLSAAYQGAPVAFALQLPDFPRPEGALYAVGFEESTEVPTAFEIGMTTWHQANGAILLAVTVYLAVWLRRPARVSPPDSSRSLSSAACKAAWAGTWWRAVSSIGRT